MEKKSQDFSKFDAIELLKTPAGRQFAAKMQQQYQTQMEQAMSLMLSGRGDEARKLLEPILQSPDAQQLMQQLGGQHG